MEDGGPTTMFCDLHTHSTCSDGTDAPDALPHLAREAGLGALALTDHDTLAGLPAAAAAAESLGLAFVPGIEWSAGGMGTSREAAWGGGPLSASRDASASPSPGPLSLHILGYFIRHDDDHLARLQQWMREARARRVPRILERLEQLGVRLTPGEVAPTPPPPDPPDLPVLPQPAASVGRPHIAQALVRKGYARSVHEAFTRYLGEGAAAYVAREKLTPPDAIEAIHHAGGLAVLAHPVRIHLPDPAALEHLVARLVDVGLDGLEVRHSDHRPADTRRLEQLARRFDLLTTGGSDYHGTRKTIALGSQRVPLTLYEQLRDASRSRAGGC